MSSELLRRLSILESKNVPQVNARLMRGGMQKRLHRQEAIRFKNEIARQKSEIKSLIAQEKLDELGIFSSQNELGDFNEPMMKRIRSKRGFF